MSKSSFIRFNPKEIRYIVLFITSIVLVIWQYYGMSTSLLVLPAQGKLLVPKVHSDEINGGLSKIQLTAQDGQVGLDCSIVLSDTFAFCGVVFPLVESGAQGIDMRRYSNMQVELEYHSEEHDTLLFYINNEEHLSNGRKLEKANLWAASASAGLNSYSLNPVRFFIPSWWIFKNHEEGLNLEPDISNTISVGLTTGDNTLARNVQITVHEISFTGKWVSADDLYLYLLIAWLTLLTGNGVVYIQSLAAGYQQSREKNRRLIKLNEFLNLQKNEFETMAKTDKLTGAWNRAGVRDLLRSVTKDYQQESTPCSLITLDIDFFKAVNDDFGHEIGDNVLRELVTLIATNTRENDHLARWGGEEFQIICSKTNKRDASRLAESLRVKIENSEFIESRTITCSFGVAGLSNEDTSEWFKRADTALYQAKKSGRNRVVTA